MVATSVLRGPCSGEDSGEKNIRDELSWLQVSNAAMKVDELKFHDLQYFFMSSLQKKSGPWEDGAGELKLPAIVRNSRVSGESLNNAP